MSDIKFGTDGWRGRIGDDYTYANLRRATQGYAGYLNAIGKGGQTVIVGHDRRFSAEHFAATAAEVLAHARGGVALEERVDEDAPSGAGPRRRRSSPRSR